jgi:hypothetical protein
MKKKIFFMVLSVLFLSNSLKADVPFRIGFQGYLTYDDGTPVNDSMTVDFLLFDSAEGGINLWFEQNTVTVADGIFTAVLGSKTPVDPAFFTGKSLYLEIQIDGISMDKRMELISNGYCFTSQKALTADKALNVPSKEDIYGWVDSKGYVKAAGCTGGQTLKWNGSSWECTKAGKTYGEGAGIDIDASDNINVKFGTNPDTAAPGNHNHDAKYDAKYAAASHNHDSAYYKKDEADTKLSGKANTQHNHDESYYKKNEVDGKLGYFAPSNHNHDTDYSPLGHNHDDIYFTEDEITEKLADYALTGHNHYGVYATAAHNHTGLYSLVTHNHDGSYVKLTDTDYITGEMIKNSVITFKHLNKNSCEDENVIKWSQSEEKWVCAPDATSGSSGSYSAGIGISIDSFKISVKRSDTDSWYAPYGHNHDYIYYQKSYLNDQLASKAAANHYHEGVYIKNAVGDINDPNDFGFSGATKIPNLDADFLDGQHGGYYLDAGNLNGTLSDLRLSNNVSKLGQTIESSEIADGTIANADIDSGAAIAWGKISCSGCIANGNITDNSIQPSKIYGTASTLTGSQNFNSGTLVIDGSHKFVGIGLTAPSSVLEVSGTVRMGKRSNLGEDSYGSFQAVGSDDVDTCDGNSGAQYSCSENDSMTCIDIKDSAYKRTVICSIAMAGIYIDEYGNVIMNHLSLMDTVEVANSVNAGIFLGDGSALTNVEAATVMNNSITTGKISDGTIMNADISSEAKISTSKISGDVMEIAFNGLGALAKLSSVTSSLITDNTIVNGDIAAGSFPNITGVGTLSSLKTSGSIYIDNIGTGGSPSVSLAIGHNSTGLHSESGGILDIYSNSVQTMTIKSGNVGIGTADPQAKLHIQSGSLMLKNPTDSPDLEWRTGTGRHWNIDQYGGNPDLRFFTQDSSDANAGMKMILTESGNVGIGTAEPQAKLDVSGSINAAGSMSLTGSVNASAGLNTAGTVSGAGLMINGVKPFIVKNFSGSEGVVFYDTGISVASYYCFIGGTQFLNGDIQENNAGTIMQSYCYQDTNWRCGGDFRSHNTNETVSVNVICVRNELVQY